ncbi:hypothetical protein ACFE04_020445 [Oxalis oulophora]
MASSNNNFNLNEEDYIQHFEKQPMFEKPLTPSDVGKLNRLVIPKQHAEKYFPLNSGGGHEDKGLLLSFEDELGKDWRFRYSYWNSSQSYVLTKGWSRYVKEKRLDAGDVVFFAREKDDSDRLFIGWRRRRSSNDGGGGGDGGGWPNGLQQQQHPYPTSGHGVVTHVPYQPHCLLAVGNETRRRRTVRLFGVNLECQLDVSETEQLTPDDGASLSSQEKNQEDPAMNKYHLFYSHSPTVLRSP